MSEFLLKSHKSIKTKHSSGHDDVGGGEQHGEAGDDGEQRVHDQTQPVNHHRSELPVSLHRSGLVFLFHLRRSVIMRANWNHRMVFYFHGKLQGHSKYIQFMFKISSILYFDASKFTSMYWFPLPPFKLFSITNWISFYLFGDNSDFL